jgi:hypothetical protein
MSVDTSTPLPESGTPEASDSVVSANSALRLLLGLLSLWTFLSGLALVIFQDASEATIGGGLSGGEGTAAQRLLGVHMLVLAPLYALLAWEPARFRLLLWVPYAALGGTLLVTLFDIITGDREIEDGLLPFVVNLVFFVLLVYVWRASHSGAAHVAEDSGNLADEVALPAAEAPPASGETASEGIPPAIKQDQGRPSA